MTFGSRLRTLRERRGLSIREIADAVGVSTTYVSFVERGLCKPPTPTRLIALAVTLGENPDRLLLAAGHLPPDVEAIIRHRPELIDSIRASAAA